MAEEHADKMAELYGRKARIYDLERRADDAADNVNRGPHGAAERGKCPAHGGDARVRVIAPHVTERGIQSQP